MSEERAERLFATGVSLALDTVTAEVTRALRGAGVRTILLKGPSTLRWLYDEETRRFSTDVDLLVAPSDVAHAEHVLGGLGFKPFQPTISGDRPAHARVWKKGGMAVDLHRTLIGIGVSEEVAWSVLSEETEALDIEGAEVEALVTGARALHIALHAAQQGGAEQGPLEDLRRGLALLPSPTWDEAAAYARRLDATEAFAVGLRLLPRGQSVAERLRLPEPRSVEVALRANVPRDLSLGLHWLSQVPGASAKTGFVFRKLAPPADWMRAWLPLARRGRAGLALAYLWRPVWLVWRLGPALLALRRARRGDNQTSA